MNVRQLAHRVDPGVLGSQAPAVPARTARADATKPAFADALQQAHRAADFRLSAHAEQRIGQRGISMNEAEQQQIGKALRTLEGKGAVDALLLRADAAFVVHVPSRTVVTAIGRLELHDRAFTQIDSALVLNAE